VVPHLVRLLVGVDHRIVLPASALFGATFLVLCDLLARTLLAPVEIPVGIVTAIIGGPFFLWLLVPRRLMVATARRGVGRGRLPRRRRAAAARGSASCRWCPPSPRCCSPSAPGRR
jgi:hypothetical protein